MSTLTKTRAKKPSAQKPGTHPSKLRRMVINPALPPLPRGSALRGLDDAIGAVHIGMASDKVSRRRTLRTRIHADNHR